MVPNESPPVNLAPPVGGDEVRTMVFRLELDRERVDALSHARAAGESIDERIPVAFSSEYGVERFDWWENERYLEILDHSAEAIDMSRAAGGLPFLDTHDGGSVERVLGRVEDIHLRGDRKLAGWLRLSRKAAAQDYRRDVEDGIAGEVSFGYRIDPTRVDVVTADGALARYIVRRWTPFEVSAVPVPADPTVGLGRSLDRSTPPAGALRRPGLVVVPRADADVSARSLSLPTSDSRTAPPAQEPATMEPDETLPTGGTPRVDVTRSEAPSEETRRKTLAQLAEKHAVNDVFARGIAAGQSLDEIGRAMTDALAERVARGPQFASPVELSDKERQRYSMANAILSADSGEASFERDVSEELARKLPQGYSPKGSGLFIPTNLGSRAAIVSATSSLGGAMVFTEQGSFIDLLRNFAAVARAGATIMSGLSAPISFPKQLTPGVAYWMAENPGSDVTESNLTFGLVTLTPKTIMATQAFSRQLLVQARNVANVEQIVRSDMALTHALGIDKAAIDGLGSSNQPLGLTKNTNVGTVTIGGNGGVPTYDHFVDQEVQVRASNVAGGLASITTPQIAGKLKKTQLFATTNGVPVWTGDLVAGTVNGNPAFATNQVPSNLTKGTSTTACHAIVTGAFPNFMIGEFGMIELITDPLSKKKQGLIEVTSFQMVDMAARYDAAFSVILDAKPA